jgi:hypothetical protein
VRGAVSLRGDVSHVCAAAVDYRSDAIWCGAIWRTFCVVVVVVVVVDDDVHVVVIDDIIDDSIKYTIYFIFHTRSYHSIVLFLVFKTQTQLVMITTCVLVFSPRTLC